MTESGSTTRPASGPPTTPSEVVRAFWNRIQQRDWSAAGDLLAPDVVVEWPSTGERFVGRDALIGVNREYPEGWEIRLLRVAADGDTVVSEVEVPMEGVGTFAVTSWWTVVAGQITRGREYWITAAGEEPPAWRSKYTERYDGRAG